MTVETHTPATTAQSVSGQPDAGSAPHGDTHASTEADGGHHGPELLGLNAEGWVYVGLTIFILLAIFVGKAPKKITDALDARIADTRRELDEAKALRAEAEALLADAKKQQAQSVKDAAAIIERAEHEATSLVSTMETEAKELISRRKKMAEDKISAAERAAIDGIRAKTVEAATGAASRLIADTHGASADAKLVDKAILGLSRPN